MFSVDARPRHLARFVWRDPRGQLIDTNTGHKYQLSVEDADIKLTINDVSINDMGSYPFEVQIITENNINKTHSENLELVVRKDPTTEIVLDKNPLLPFVQPDKTYSVNCNVNGHPVDKNSVEFYYSYCDTFPNQDNCDNRKIKLMSSPLSQTDNGTDPRYHFNFTTLASIHTNRNMKIGCSACSSGSKPECGSKGSHPFCQCLVYIFFFLKGLSTNVPPNSP